MPGISTKIMGTFQAQPSREVASVGALRGTHRIGNPVRSMPSWNHPGASRAFYVQVGERVADKIVFSMTELTSKLSGGG